MRRFFALLACAVLWNHTALAAETGDIDEGEFESMLEQRVESAARYDQSTRDAAASVTLVTAEEIERYGFRTLDAVLRSVRSFYSSNDRNYAYAGMRGFGRPGDYNNRILLLIDGHAINDNVYGSAPLGTELGGVDLRTVERIEIVRGPGSALYGANAMLAVINVISKEPKSISPAQFDIETGSDGYMKGGATLARTVGDGVQLLLSGQATQIDGANLYYPEYDDPSTNGGMADERDWDDYYDVQGTIKSRNFQLEGMWASREKGIPTGAWGVDFNHPDTRTLDRHAFLDAQYHHSFSGSHSTVARAYANRYEYEGRWPFAGVETRDASDGRWYGLELRHMWDARSNVRIVAGAAAEKHARSDYRLWTGDVLDFSRDVSFELFSGYVQGDIQPARWLSLMLGGRIDDYSNYESNLAPRAAVIVNPGPSSAVKLLYGQAFRVPTFWERYYEDPAQGYKTNGALEPEQIDTYEIVWEQNIADGVSGSVSLFENRFDGLIDTVIDPVDSLYVNRNLTSARARGAEFELRGAVASIGGYASYSRQEAEDDQGNWLTNSPRHLAKLGVVMPVWSQLRFGVESQYETGRLTVYGTETDSFVLVNLNLTTALHPLGTRTTASLLVRNLFDESYGTPGGYEHVQPVIEQDGRSIIVGLQTRF
ncbi:MAG TPA: TonB-dependent receptor [Candidatus Krumholzibacteria bacterium]